MKRKTANSTIDEFFITSMKRAPPMITNPGNSLKNNIVIVKKASQKKVLQISIPSLQQKENEPDNELLEKKFTDISDSLIDGIDILFSGNFDQVNFTKLHNDVECYCRFKSSKILFENFLMPKLSSIIDNFIEELSQPNLDIFQISNMIQTFEESLSNLRKIILYLDRAYIFAHRINGFLSISDIVHNQFRKNFLEQINDADHRDFSSKSKSTLNMIIAQIKLQINLFRCNHETKSEELRIPNNYSMVDGRFIKDRTDDGSSKAQVSYHSYEDTSKSDEGSKALSIVLKFLDELGLYESNIEGELIKQAEEYYSTIRQELSLIEFLDWLTISQEKELELLEAGVKESTINYIFQSINQITLVDNQDHLFGSEFREAVDTRNDAIIQKLFSFFDRTELRSIFTSNLGEYFAFLADNMFKEGTNNPSDQPLSIGSTVGRTIAETEKSPPQDVIVNLINLYNYALEYISEVFPQNTAVLSDVKSKFDHYFSQNSETLAKLLARHFAKGLPIEKKEIEFFKMIHAKDFFEASYFTLIKDKVLDWNHPIDVDREKELINHIKEIAGAMLTQRLQILIDDVEVSQKVERSIQHDLDKSIKFNAVALDWKNVSNETFTDSVKYPLNIQNNMTIFTQKFVDEKKSKFSEPQLHWSSKHSTVIGNIGETKCQMTGDQALILLALQSKKESIFSLDDIHEITGINPDTISDNLSVMQKKEAGFIVKAIDKDSFCLNPDSSFNSDDSDPKKKKKKIIFPSTSSVIAQKEREAKESYIEVIKHNKIECSIMQKMKVFKILSLTELYSKVKRDVKFEPNQKIFADIVSNLVKKDFLERVNDKQLKYVIM